MINPSSYDLAFIGSGISSTFTFLHFLKQVKEESSSKLIQIAIIDQYPEFHCGIPYGNRSGHTTLLITSLKNFLPEPHLSDFNRWLTFNKEKLLEEFKAQGGPLSLKWTQEFGDSLKRNDWGELFIPRTFFGRYIDEKITTLINQLEASEKIKVTYIHDKVQDATRRNGLWEVIRKNGPSLSTLKLILAIGSPPTKYLWKDQVQVEKNKFILFNDPYKWELGETLKAILDFIQKHKNLKPNIAIIGANASGLEILYQINDRPKIKEYINHFYILSSQGLLPDSTKDDLKLKDYSTSNLDALSLKEQITASEIANAVYQDLDKADDIMLGAASTIEVISNKFGHLLKKLDQKELTNFACFHGNQIGRRQRCAGKHYANTVDLLKKDNKISHIAGRFVDLIPEPNGYILVYTDRDGNHQRFEQPVNLVINCTGGMQLNHTKVPKILRNLIRKGTIVPNESMIGIKVDEKLQAASNFYVIGPLLAGNVIENKAVWHVEHCGRIIWLSEVLAGFLYNKTNDFMELQLEILYLDDASGLRIYNDLIATEYNNHPYYLHDYLSHHYNGADRLIAFNFMVNSRSTVVMPMVIREIQLNGELHFDVISPYGYSGPLFREGTESKSIEAFWKAVDQWYVENNVVSEFIRFHLNGNQEHYSGDIIPTLDNIYGSLMDSFEEQWDTFLPKVRNNYRKAERANLSIEFYSHNKISKKHIAEFYQIYLSTMERNDASKALYFSLEHFENLVLNNNEKFSLVFVYKDGFPISTELIIQLDDCIYGYLGGTLSDYFSYRPNDFLRVEVIRWAIENSVKHYILGGGISNGDGLYRYKKSLFPNSPDRTYYTGRKIISPSKYNELCSMESISMEEYDDVSFFPLYRKKD